MMNESISLAMNDDKTRKQVIDNLHEFTRDILDDLPNNTRRAYLSDFEQFCSRSNFLTSETKYPHI